MWQVDIADVVTEEERSHVPPFNMLAAYWDAIVRSEHACRLYIYRTDGNDHEPLSDEEEPSLSPPPRYADH